MQNLLMTAGDTYFRQSVFVKGGLIMRKLPNCPAEDAGVVPFSSSDLLSLFRRRKNGNNDDDGQPQKELTCDYNPWSGPKDDPGDDGPDF